MKEKIILKASAGTGKTYRLSLEYIKSLAMGVDFKEILVMTFTRKATSEIKERILSFLYEICTDEIKKQEIEGNLQKIYGEDLKLDVEKLRKIYQEISENKDKLKIYTIDGFTNMIFRKSIAPYLKIYSYEIIDDEENKKILQKTFQKLFETKEAFAVFRDFLNDNSEKDMENYLNIIRSILNERWKFILFGDGFEQEKFRFDHGDYLENLEDIFKVLDVVAKIKGKNPEECIKKKYLPLLNEYEKEEFIRENYGMFLEDKDFWDNNKLRVTKAHQIQDEKDKMTQMYEEFQRNLAKRVYNEEVVTYEEQLLKTLKTIYTIYDDIKIREKRFTHLDISNYTFKYLRDENIGFVDEAGNLTDDFFEMIDCDIKTIFIDEFQDTSILQWKILKNIIDRCENIICVGDEKQSIYGWRGGEKRLFENLENIIGGDVEVLDTCYRSRKNIVEYANKVFGILSKESEFSEPWTYTPVNFIPKSDDGSVETIAMSSDEDAIVAMVEKIERDFKGNYNGIGIISRKTKTLNKIAEVLASKDIPYTLQTDKRVFEGSSVAPLYSLIRWLVRGDYLSLLDFFRSDLIMMSNDELIDIIEAREVIENWISSPIDEDDVHIYSANLVLAKSIYHEYINCNGEVECLIYPLIKKLGLLNTFQTKEDTQDIFEFYRLLKTYRYFSDFITEVEEQEQSNKFKKQSKENTGITLLTIHKSKGLEFETVYYYIDNSRKPGARPELKIYFTIDKSYTKIEDYLITNSRYNKIFKVLKEFNYVEAQEEKEKVEELNNLYVALTRPKKNLVVVIENEKKIEKELALSAMYEENIIGKLKYDIVEDPKLEITEELDIDLSSEEKIYKVDIEENKEIGREKIQTHNLNVENRRVRGNIVHFFLENLSTWTDEEVNTAKKLTFTKYSSVIGNEELVEILSDRNIAGIKEKCKELFSSSWDYVYKEYPIYIKDEENNTTETVRLDRIMIKRARADVRGVIFIADYKTGGYDEAQLRKYEDAVRTLLKNYKIKEDEYEIKSSFIELNV